MAKCLFVFIIFSVLLFLFFCVSHQNSDLAGNISFHEKNYLQPCFAIRDVIDFLLGWFFFIVTAGY